MAEEVSIRELWWPFDDLKTYCQAAKECRRLRHLLENYGFRGKPGYTLRTGRFEEGDHFGCPFLELRNESEGYVLLIVWTPDEPLQTVTLIDDSGSET